MATRDVKESLFSKERSTPIPRNCFVVPEPEAILTAFPGLAAEPTQLGSAAFLPWIDFTLENPDEIWETSDEETFGVYWYVNYFEAEGMPPAFAVEVSAGDEAAQVCGFTLVLREEDFEGLQRTNLVYSRRRDWEREQRVRWLNDRALMRYEEERLEEAQELINAAIHLSGSRCAYLLNNRGLICWKMGETTQAKRDFLESISLEKENGDPYFNMGLICFDESDYERALHYLERAVEIHPTDIQFLTELGHLYLELGREKEALTLFRQVRENDPTDARVDFHLGHYFLYKKRQARNAVRYFDEGLKKDPDAQFATADLAVAHWVLGNTRKTRQIYEDLQSKPFLLPYTMSRLVYLNAEMGDYENALRYYHEALSQNDPFEPEWLHYNAALVYTKMGRPKQALVTLDLAVKAGGDAVVQRALTDNALRDLKAMPDFKKLMRLHAKRKNR